jgi:hypothetical protein
VLKLNDKVFKCPYLQALSVIQRYNALAAIGISVPTSLAIQVLDDQTWIAMDYIQRIVDISMLRMSEWKTRPDLLGSILYSAFARYALIVRGPLIKILHLRI